MSREGVDPAATDLRTRDAPRPRHRRAVTGAVVRRSCFGDTRHGDGDDGTSPRLSGRSEFRSESRRRLSTESRRYGAPRQAMTARQIVCWSYAGPSIGDCPNDSANRASVRDRGVGGSNPLAPTKFHWSIPVTWVTVHSGDIGNTFEPKGFWIGSSLHVSSSKYPRSYCMKLTSQMRSPTWVTPTFCPARA